MKKRWKLLISIIVTLILLGILVTYNIMYNCKFFELSISSLLSLLIAIFISYYLVQKNTDQRYQKEIYRNLLIDIQKLVTDPSIYTVKTDRDITTITAKKRNLSNYIGIIDSHSQKFNLNKEVIFIKEKFQEYDSIIGNNISDITYLQNNTKDMQRPLDLINNKLYEMMLKLYN